MPSKIRSSKSRRSCDCTLRSFQFSCDTWGRMRRCLCFLRPSPPVKLAWPPHTSYLPHATCLYTRSRIRSRILCRSSSSLLCSQHEHAYHSSDLGTSEQAGPSQELSVLRTCQIFRLGQPYCAPSESDVSYHQRSPSCTRN